MIYCYDQSDLETVKAIEYVLEVSDADVRGMSSVDEIVRFIERHTLPPTIQVTEWAFMVSTHHF